MNGTSAHEHGSQVPIVFVHLGGSRARWLPPNIERTRRMDFGDVWLITDNPRMAERARELGARTWLPADDDLAPTDAGGYDFNIRMGFWRASLRRFEVLAAFQATTGAPLVHVESDVVLLPGFDPSALRAFRAQLAYPLLKPGHGIGSVVYMGSPEASAALAASIRQARRQREEINDMQALGRFADEHPDLVAILPTVNPEWPADCCRDAQFRQRASTNFAAVEVVFDGATLGQYLLGLDPRNHRGKRILHRSEPSHGLDATRLELRLVDGVLLVGPKGGSITTPLVNLHVHSKDLRAFDLGRSEALLARRLAAGLDTPRVEFDPWGLASQAGDVVRRRWNHKRRRHDQRRGSQDHEQPGRVPAPVAPRPTPPPTARAD